MRDLIQETLLESDPAFKGRFTLQMNKVVNVNGTRHEIDMFVVLHPDTPFQSVVLFECKDWKKRVSKNEVIILKEKVDQIGAARGVLIAPGISKSAKGLLAQPQYQRIEHRRCTINQIQDIRLRLTDLMHDPVGIRVSVTARSATVLPENLLQQVLRWQDRIALLDAFVRERVDAMVLEDRKEHSAMYRQ